MRKNNHGDLIRVRNKIPIPGVFLHFVVSFFIVQRTSIVSSWHYRIRLFLSRQLSLLSVVGRKNLQFESLIAVDVTFALLRVVFSFSCRLFIILYLLQFSSWLVILQLFTFPFLWTSEQARQFTRHLTRMQVLSNLATCEEIVALVVLSSYPFVFCVAFEWNKRTGTK